MDKNEIKKLFYKNEIFAYLSKIKKGLAYYKATFGETEYSFIVPVSDMGEADFFYAMQAKYLVRWLQE